MQYRVTNIIETLRNLPEPGYDGQVLNVPIIKNIDDYDFLEKDIIPTATEIKFLTVIAKRYRRAKREWLEWTYEV